MSHALAKQPAVTNTPARTSSDRHNAPSTSKPAYNFSPFSVIQRCACGGSCPSCQAEKEKKALPIQTKLRIGAPNDRYEQEADRIADQVMRMPDPEAVQTKPIFTKITPLVQRQRDEQEDDEQVQAKLQSSLIQRQEDTEDEDKPAQAKLINNQAKTPLIQRQENEDEEEPVQAKQENSLLQRQEDTEDDEPVQAKLINDTLIQRQSESDSEEEEEPLQTKSLNSDLIQRQENTAEDEDEQIQTKRTDKSVFASTTKVKSSVNTMREGGDGLALDNNSNFESDLYRAKGSGMSLPETTQSFMGQRFGTDFNQVRIHTDHNAAVLNQHIGARAFTHGRDIFFNTGHYSPQSDTGKRLLAHELTHVIQQTGNQKSKSFPVLRSPTLIQRSILWFVPGWIRKKIAKVAQQLPFFDLISVLLGKNPITDEKVPWTGLNIVKALLPNFLIKQLKETKQLVPTGEWLGKRLEELNISWEGIKQLFKLAWKRTSITLLSPSKTVRSAKSAIIQTFEPLILRIGNFVSAITGKVKEFIIQGALSLAGKLGKKVFQVFKRSRKVLSSIINNPIGFIKRFLSAVSQGFTLFKKNFDKHFKGVLFGWLFGTFSKAGIDLPKKFDLKTTFGFIAQILNFTYQYVRDRVVKRLGRRGETIISMVERSVGFIKRLKKEGPKAMWSRVKKKLGKLHEKIIPPVMSWVRNSVILKGIAKLATMANPVGALFTVAKAVYDVVSFLIERGQQLKGFVSSIFGSITKVAAGNIKGAAKYIEGVLARGITLSVSLLAQLIGLGGISQKIKSVLKHLRKPIGRAINKTVRWIVWRAKSFWRKRKGKGKAAMEAKHKRMLEKLSKRFKKDDGPKKLDDKGWMDYKRLLAKKFEKEMNRKLKKGVKLTINIEDIKGIKQLRYRMRIAPNASELKDTDDVGGMNKDCIEEFKVPDPATPKIVKLLRLGAEFKMIIKFKDTPECDCSRGEYRQLVKGYFKKDGIKEKHTLGRSGLMEENVWKEDSSSSVRFPRHYGHRINADNIDEDKYLPDRKTGCKYEGYDWPGMEISKNHFLEVNLDFWGGVIDNKGKDNPQFDPNNPKFLKDNKWSVNGVYRLSKGQKLLKYLKSLKKKL